MTGPATTRVDVEEIETTKSEKLLAVVLAAFLLIGGIWTYDKLGELAQRAVGPDAGPVHRPAIDRLTAADARAAAASGEEQRALDALVLAREAYRTALDADEPAAGLRLEYQAAERAHARAEAETRAARAAAAAARPAGVAAQRELAEDTERVADREALLAFGFRFALAGALLGLGFWLLARLRRAGSRWFPLAVGFVGFATVLAFGFAGDYVTDYVDPLDLGPLVLSLLGIALTLAGFAALQRYLARRIPARRVRKRDCAFCGYPVGEGNHCEGCGRAVVASCARCTQPRRVGTLHCRACGQA
jgi:hypothetical protein